MTHPKLLPHVAAIILASTIVSIVVAPTGETQATPDLTATFSRPPVKLTDRPLTVEPQLVKRPDRWEKFQKEFGFDQEIAPASLAPIANAKYGADLTLYTANTLLERLEAILELRYTQGRIVPAAMFPRTKPVQLARGPVTFEDARLKVDFELTRGRPYLGLRLVLPFGN